MALTQRLELRQGQSLVMTPQLQQAIKLLQMSNLELQSFVEGELERNPLLERDEREDGPAPVQQAAEDNTPDAATALKDEGGLAERIEGLGTGLENVYADEARADQDNRLPPGPADSGWTSIKSGGGVSLDSDELDFGATLSRDKTLAEHLTDQLNLTTLDLADKLIGQNLIGAINEAGYLSSDVTSVAEMLGAGIEQVERVLGVLQGFDPPGVFARDLKECLALQLKDRDRYDPAMAALIENLELVAKRDFQALKIACKVDLDDIKDMITEIRRLDPKPGHAFGSDPVQPVVPDAFIRLAPDGSWLVELNSETLPRVIVNNRYMATVSSRAAKAPEKEYLTECHANATWLVKSLDQRAKTILKVAREIVRQQDAFLVLGVQHLRPINLKTVADAISMHESTVSRVTSNKYMATPRGTFEFKYFFTTAISSSTEGGQSHSSESVRHRIKEMIDAEVAAEVLSDDMIVENLKQAGIDIARRTVAKYRESLGIQSSVQRRREKRAYKS